MKKCISEVYPSVLDALRSLFSNFSKYIFPFFWEEGYTEYDLIIFIFIYIDLYIVYKLFLYLSDLLLVVREYLIT